MPEDWERIREEIEYAGVVLVMALAALALAAWTPYRWESSGLAVGAIACSYPIYQAIARLRKGLPL